MLCFWRIAVVFQSLHGTGPQYSKRKDFTDGELYHLFSLRWPFLPAGYSLDVA